MIVLIISCVLAVVHTWACNVSSSRILFPAFPIHMLCLVSALYDLRGFEFLYPSITFHTLWWWRIHCAIRPCKGLDRVFSMYSQFCNWAVWRSFLFVAPVCRVFTRTVSVSCHTLIHGCSILATLDSYFFPMYFLFLIFSYIRRSSFPPPLKFWKVFRVHDSILISCTFRMASAIERGSRHQLPQVGAAQGISNGRFRIVEESEPLNSRNSFPFCEKVYPSRRPKLFLA